jgi:hypothetical protein
MGFTMGLAGIVSAGVEEDGAAAGAGAAVWA